MDTTDLIKLLAEEESRTKSGALIDGFEYIEGLRHLKKNKVNSNLSSEDTSRVSSEERKLFIQSFIHKKCGNSRSREGINSLHMRNYHK